MPDEGKAGSATSLDCLILKLMAIADDIREREDCKERINGLVRKSVHETGDGQKRTDAQIGLAEKELRAVTERMENAHGGNWALAPLSSFRAAVEALGKLDSITDAAVEMLAEGCSIADAELFILRSAVRACVLEMIGEGRTSRLLRLPNGALRFEGADFFGRVAMRLSDPLLGKLNIPSAVRVEVRANRLQLQKPKRQPVFGRMLVS
ncbi:MAG: hypothetical protein WC588_05115 [Candidatus Micrarchaeia archaeon]